MGGFGFLVFVVIFLSESIDFSVGWCFFFFFLGFLGTSDSVIVICVIWIGLDF